LWKYNPYTNQWVWVKGDSAQSSWGIYGVKGVSNPNNTPGGGEAHVGWVDENGTMWLYGGTGYNDQGQTGGLSDLWKYNPVINEWAWIHGTKNLNQSPSYGPQGIYSSTSHPGTRIASATWVDTSGSLWLFGGGGYDVFNNNEGLGDLWKYNPVTNQWAWIRGSQIGGRGGSYGTKGTPAATNIPGARAWSVTWVDKNGVFWMFGGEGYGSQGNRGSLNDLWKYNPSTNEWVWVHGNKISRINSNQNAQYGNIGDFCSVCTPGVRSHSSGWYDSDNHGLWLFGGSNNTGGNSLNDLWFYDINRGEWAWIKGSQSQNQSGSYG
jgi:N-acetylneuraminic acid mutarotase